MPAGGREDNVGKDGRYSRKNRPVELLRLCSTEGYAFSEVCQSAFHKSGVACAGIVLRRIPASPGQDASKTSRHPGKWTYNGHDREEKQQFTPENSWEQPPRFWRLLPAAPEKTQILGEGVWDLSPLDKMRKR
jgi:hypothetical protein